MYSLPSFPSCAGLFMWTWSACVMMVMSVMPQSLLQQLPWLTVSIPSSSLPIHTHYFHCPLPPAQLPDVSMESMLPSVSLHRTTPLHLTSLPVSTTFGLFQTLVKPFLHIMHYLGLYLEYYVHAQSHSSRPHSGRRTCVYWEVDSGYP